MREPTRVLHVINGLFHGGGQRAADDLVDVLPRFEGVDVRLCTLGKGAPIAARAEESIPYDGRYNRLSVLLRTSRALGRILDSCAADIVHTHGVDADLIGALAVRGRRVRQLCHLHTSPPTHETSWRAKVRRMLFHHFTARNGAWFIAVSVAVRDQMLLYYKLPSERTITVRNGIHTDLFATDRGNRRRTAGPLVIGTAARLAPMKGLEYLIDAAQRLTQNGMVFELRIAGAGMLRDELQRRAAAAGVAQRVSFLGHVDDMQAFYQELDVFVLPSLTEGLPLTVLEAMASALPVVATNVGGTAEAVRDGIDGWIVPSRDVAALSGALASLLASADLRKTMGQAGRERAIQEFSRERVAAEVFDVYCRMLARKPAMAELAS